MLKRPRPRDRAPKSASSTVAHNTLIQVFADAVGKLSSVVFYVLMARELGQSDFGIFTFAVSLAFVCTAIAGLGTDFVITRDTALDRDRLHWTVAHSLVLKVVLGAAGGAVALAIAAGTGKSTTVFVTVALLVLAALADLLAKSFYAAWRGLDNMFPVATGQLLQRLLTAALGIGALLAGYGVVTVAAVYLFGTLVALAYITVSLLLRIGRLRLGVSFPGARQMARASAAMGVTTVFGAVLTRLDATLLSLFKSDADVGIYGAAYRNFDSTLFISWALGFAALPAIARATRGASPTLGEVFQMTSKVVALALLPLGTAMALYAHDLVVLLYGEEYAAAEAPTRLLAGAAAVYGFYTVSSYVLASHQRDKAVMIVTGLGAALNVVANLILIPPYSYRGAAAAMLISQVALSAATAAMAWRVAERPGVVRVFAAPVIGCGAMAAITWAAGTTWLSLAGALGAYVLAVAAVERLVYPDDLRRMIASVRPRPSVSEA